MVNPRLSRSVAWTVSGTFVFALSQWAIVALIAKLSGAAELGQFALAAAVVAPVLALTQLQLRAVLATDSRYERRLQDFLALRTWLTIAMATATPLISWAVGADSVTLGVISAFVVAKSLDSLADILYGYHQRREDMRVIAVGQLINGVLSVLLFGVLLAATANLIIATLGYALASGLTLVGWAIPVTVRKRKVDHDDPRNQAPAKMILFLSALPLGIVMVLAGLGANLPRYAIQLDLGESALGIFGGLAYIVLVGTNLIGAIGQAASPRLAKHVSAGRIDQFRRLLAVLLGVSVATAGLGVLVSAVWGRPVLEWLYTAEFAEYAEVLVALAAASLFTFPAIVLAVAATATRSFRAQLPVFVAVLVVGVVACYFLVPLWGLIGAAVATGLMGLVQAGGCALLVKSALGEHS